jgi:hypothetical protein
MAAVCASIQGVWTRLSGTAEKLSASEPAASTDLEPDALPLHEIPHPLTPQETTM